VGYGGASMGNSSETEYRVGDKGYVQPLAPAKDGSHQMSVLARIDMKQGDTSLWGSIGGASRKLGFIPGIQNRMYDTNTLLAGWREGWTSTFSTELRVHQVLHKSEIHLEENGSAAQYRALRQVLGLSDVDLSGNYSFADTSTTVLELQANWDPSKELHFVGGLDSRRIESKKVVFLGLNEDGKESASGGFLSMDWTFQPEWTLSLGARAENDSQGGSRTSPRGSLVWAVSPSSILRGGFYTSSRSPQVLEQDVDYVYGWMAGPALTVFTIVPNESLKPEKTECLELGFRQLIGPVTLDLTLYSMAIKNQITQTIVQVSPSIPQITAQYQNRGDASNKGLELALTWAVQKGWNLGLNGRYLTYEQDHATNGPAALNGEFSYAPKHVVTLWTRFAKGPWSGYADVQHVAAAHVEALTPVGTNLFDERPARIQFDAQLAYEVIKGLGIGAYVRNGAREYTPMGTSGPDRPTNYQPVRREMGATASYRF
jgi:outer membrane receptor protein involved in Fe transport